MSTHMVASHTDHSDRVSSSYFRSGFVSIRYSCCPAGFYVKIKALRSPAGGNPHGFADKSRTQLTLEISHLWTLAGTSWHASVGCFWVASVRMVYL